MSEIIIDAVLIFLVAFFIALAWKVVRLGILSHKKLAKYLNS